VGDPSVDPGRGVGVQAEGFGEERAEEPPPEHEGQVKCCPLGVVAGAQPAKC